MPARIAELDRWFGMTETEVRRPGMPGGCWAAVGRPKNPLRIFQSSKALGNPSTHANIHTKIEVWRPGCRRPLAGVGPPLFPKTDRSPLNPLRLFQSSKALGNPSTHAKGTRCGALYKVHGARYTVQGTRCKMHGARYTVQCTRYKVHGISYMAHGTRHR